MPNTLQNGVRNLAETPPTHPKMTPQRTTWHGQAHVTPRPASGGVHFLRPTNGRFDPLGRNSSFYNGFATPPNTNAKRNRCHFGRDFFRFASVLALFGGCFDKVSDAV